ncbi:MAG: YhbY family RNA-binding protein [Angelakisella sp.]|nr:YhbY family RNA-binding protein [Angelakisella sp.]MCI9667457.1 YhbY family RNA-binding protein [Angelakisella sp.]
MLTSKQRARLKSIAASTETILQIGKGGVGEQLVKQVDDALTARELVKLRALETAPEEPGELAQALAEATGSQVVQVIGRRLVLYRKNPKKPVILLD